MFFFKNGLASRSGWTGNPFIFFDTTASMKATKFITSEYFHILESLHISSTTLTSSTIKSAAPLISLFQKQFCSVKICSLKSLLVVFGKKSFYVKELKQNLPLFAVWQSQFLQANPRLNTATPQRG